MPVASDGGEAITATTRKTASPLHSVRTTIVGSFVELELPKNFDDLLSNGQLIDPRNNTPMEMDGYSTYLALTALEARMDCSLGREKSILLEAVLRRLHGAAPAFSHGAWTGSSKEVHMRFTAAAVRLIAEALKDGLLTNSDTLTQALRYHLSHSEHIEFGTWFLHDSLEIAATAVANPHRRTRNRAWGSSVENNLVLNTHLDTLSTAIEALPLLPEHDAVWLEQEIEKGIAALSGVLGARHGIAERLSTIDRLVRHAIFRSYGSDARGIARLRSKFVHAYFPIRARLRSRWPSYVMNDGYLERDISLLGTGFEYHLVNVYDLARFAHQLRNSRFASHADLVRMCEALAERGIDHAIRSSYWQHVVWSTRSTSRAVILCEAILLQLARWEGQAVPQHWLRAYCEVRRRVAPSAAILGYDPFTVRPLGGNGQRSIDEDYIRLVDDRCLKINVRDTAYEWC